MKILPIIGLAAGAGALYLVSKGSSLSNMAKNLTYKIRLNGKPKLYAGGFWTLLTSVVAGGSGSRLRLPVAIDFENRSDEEITIGVNALFVYYKDTKLASNGVTPSTVTIKKYATSTMEGLDIDIEISSLKQVAGDLVNTWLTGQDFSSLTSNLSVQLSAVINNALVINLTRALGEETTVSTDTAVSGIDGTNEAAPDGYVWVDDGYISGLDGSKRKKKKLKKATAATAATATTVKKVKAASNTTANTATSTSSASTTKKGGLRKALKNIAAQTKAAAENIAATKTSVSGLGLVANSKRKIKDIGDYIAYIPGKENLNNKDLVVIADGNAQDTANLMHKVVDKYYTDVTTLANRLKQDTLKDTLQNIWNFVYTHIDYVPDSRVREQVRRPLRTLYDQKGDCDCYATLIGSLLKNLGIGFRFRIAAYSAGVYQHVYVVVPYDGGYYTVDPVLDECFAEKTPSKFFDV